MSKMKYSGIEWIGDIPIDWKIKKIKYIYNIQTGFTPDTTREDYYSIDEKNIWVSIADLTNIEGKYIKNSSNYISDLYIKDKHPKIIKKGSLLYSFKLSVGKTAFAERDLYTNEAIASFTNNFSVCLNYLNYASFLIEYNANRNIYNALILNQELIKNSFTIMPSLDEQKLISKFLDEKVLCIDKILYDLNKQVGILENLKKSIICEKIPCNIVGKKLMSTKEFEKTKLGYKISVLTDYHANGSYETLNEHVTLLDEPNYALMIRTTDLEKKSFDKDCVYIDENAYHFLSKSKVYGNEVIINKIGSAGKVYFMPDLGRPVSLAMNQFLLRFIEGVNPKYIYYYLNTKYAEEQILQRVQGAVTLTITKDAVRSIPLLIPNYLKQKEIVDYLDEKCEQIDKIIEEKQKQIEKIEEYKKSVIYEYVTGKKRVEGAEELYG